VFVCPAVMKGPSQANIAFHSVVPQSGSMSPWMHNLKSSIHEEKSNNVRKESANCSHHQYTHSVSVCSLRSPLCFLTEFIGWFACVIWIVT